MGAMFALPSIDPCLFTNLLIKLTKRNRNKERGGLSVCVEGVKHKKQEKKGRARGRTLRLHSSACAN